MKNLFILTAIVALFVACSETKPKIQTTLSKTTETKFKLNNDKLGLNSDGVVTASDKHDYLVINNKMDRMSVSHYVDCKKCKSK